MGTRTVRTILGVVSAVVVLTAGVAYGAAGQPLIMGMANSADTSNTTLKTSSTGVAFGVTQSGGAGPAVRGTDSSSTANSTGVLGNASGSTGLTYGVRGSSASTGGRGVYGLASATSGTTIGVYGLASSPNGSGVYGSNNAATAGTGSGGYFLGGKNNGVIAKAGDGQSGVLGQNTGNGDGVLGTSLTGNGVVGKTSASFASGVYGENNGSGFGVAGRSNVPGGIGLYGEATGGATSHAVAAVSSGTGGTVDATNFGSGPAVALHTTGGAPPMTVDSSTQVNNLNADMVDGHHAADFLPAGGKAVDADKLDGKDSTQFLTANPGSGAHLFTNVLVGGTAGQVILHFPDLGGDLKVVSCNSGKAQMSFSTGGQALNIMDSGSFFNNSNHSPEADTGFDTTTLAIPATGAASRGTFTVNVQVVNTKLMATIWVSWDATFNAGCVFMAQAIEAIGS